MIRLFKPYVASCTASQKLYEIFNKGDLTEGEYSDSFEEKISEYIGNKNTSLTNSGTSALHLAGILSGIEKGDEVITTAMTCMATNEPFYNMGAKLVFADIDITTGNICPESIRSKITDKTKAIVAVHWAGQPVEIDEINDIAKEFNIKVIEDAAHAFGSSYKGKRIGSHSDFVCFSFQAIKHLTCGDGGAIACKSQEDVERARKIRWFGLDRKYKGKSRWDQDIVESGYKYHMNNINAVIGLENIRNIKYIIDTHIRNRNYYDEHIVNPKIVKMRKPDYTVSSSWIYSILTEDRETLKSYLADNGIDSDRVHVRNDQYSVFGGRDESLKNLNKFDSNLLNIPVGWWVEEGQAAKISRVLNKF